MPDLWASLLATEGLALLGLAAFVSGLVRGFSGFGTALVYLPVAAQVLPPFGAILTLIFMDVLAPLPNLKRAWASVDRPDLARLSLACFLLLPVGLWVLDSVSPEAFRILVSGLALAMLAVLIAGLRWRGAVPPRAVTGIGAVSGFLGGVAGVPGPPVILFYMARPLEPARIRATILLYLFAFDLMMMGWLAGFGLLAAEFVVLGLALGLPGMAGNWLGGRLFDPARERFYRAAAYGLIALAALSGLLVRG